MLFCAPAFEIDIVVLIHNIVTSAVVTRLMKLLLFCWIIQRQLQRFPDSSYLLAQVYIFSSFFDI